MMCKSASHTSQRVETRVGIIEQLTPDDSAFYIEEYMSLGGLFIYPKDPKPMGNGR